MAKKTTKKANLPIAGSDQSPKNKHDSFAPNINNVSAPISQVKADFPVFANAQRNFRDSVAAKIRKQKD